MTCGRRWNRGMLLAISFGGMTIRKFFRENSACFEDGISTCQAPRVGMQTRQGGRVCEASRNTVIR